MGNQTTSPFFPLKEQSKYTVSLEPIKDKMCCCGHEGDRHLSQGNRTCLTAGCDCVKYDQYSPKFTTKKDFTEQALVYFEKQKTMLENVRWVFENLKFFRNYSNDELGWAWGKFVLGFDPFNQFMTDDILKKIKQYGTHSTVEREARRLREECKKTHTDCTAKSHENCTHDCNYCPYDPSLIDHKLIKEYGMHSFFSENRLG